MAKSSRREKQQFGSKSAFVRSLPADIPAKDVVAQAAAQGMKLSVGQVYNIRSVSKKRKNGAVTRRPVGRPAGSGSSGGGNAEAALRRAIAELGLAKSREVLSEVEATFRG